METKAVVFAINHQNLNGGEKNDWSWFKDPHRNIILIRLKTLRPPFEAPIDKEFFLYQNLLSFLAEKDIPHSAVVFVTDSDEIRWANEMGFITVVVRSEERLTRLEGNYFCSNNVDSIIRIINAFENKDKTK